MSPLWFSVSTKKTLQFFPEPAISPIVVGSSCGLCASFFPYFFLNKSTPQTCQTIPQHQLHSQPSLDTTKQRHVPA